MGKNKKKSVKKHNNQILASSEQPKEEKKPALEQEKEHNSQRDEESKSDDGTEEADDQRNNSGNAEPVQEIKQELIGSTESTEIEGLRSEIEKLKLELAEEKELHQKHQTKYQDESNLNNSISQDELKKVRAERDEFEAQYNNLLSRISSMKTVFNKMKESQDELENVKEQLAEYESQNVRLKKKLETSNKERAEIENTVVTLNQEYLNLESERENLQSECYQYREELDVLKEQLEKSSFMHARELEAYSKEKDRLSVQLQDLMVILDNNKQDIYLLKEEKEDLLLSLESSKNEKKALQESMKELESEIKKNSSMHKEELQQRSLEINTLRAQLDKSLESKNEDSKTMKELKLQIESMKEDVIMKEKYERECKERVLQIGKLRHEAIILNEHLTKALTMLKQTSDSESVDKELISNLLISFVAIPRADPRKFEVLELISSFLNWDEDKKKQAGLIYSNERESNSAGSGSRAENFVSMWTDFLEKESEK